jgi:hypothetical protein
MPDQRRSLRPLPSDVEGYAAAVAAGLTPARPSTPPDITGRPTARNAFRQLATTFAVAVAPAVLWTVLLADERIGGKGGAIAYVAILVIAYFVVRVPLHRCRDILLEELQAGYTTRTFTQGLFWIPRGPGRSMKGDDVIGWIWDGLWVLDVHGNVVSAPDRSIDPPGLYPSPHRPGQLELWTGCQWAGVYPRI